MKENVGICNLLRKCVFMGLCVLLILVSCLFIASGLYDLIFGRWLGGLSVVYGLVGSSLFAKALIVLYKGYK